MRVVVLFTRDLRVHDHPALWEATRVADEVVPLFVLDPLLLARSPNRGRFLAQCLIDLDRSLASRGGRLVVREGDPAAQAAALAGAYGCDAVFVTEDVSATARARERRLREALAPLGVELRTCPGNAVVEAGAVHPSERTTYRVFTPYLRAWRAHPRRTVLPAPRAVRTPVDVEPGRLPHPAAIAPTATDLPPGGEGPARRRLRRFVADGTGRYGDLRNDLAADATSRLSPYLRFGCISATEAAAIGGGADRSGEWIRQLAWRDFFRQLLHAHPWMVARDLRPHRAVRTVADDRLLDAWAQGRTGVPIVDAGMRQLLHEGWMPNRARLITASYLTRTLGVPWQEGLRIFDRHLLDGDPANNAGNWQWVAGTGVAPRRGAALNPVRQAQRFDPRGDYVRRHVPELAHVHDARILRPWVDADLLAATGYPAPAAGPIT
ncbi:MAG: deoxyribodipyrimidine photo-lyase [Actinomycetota bacterium]|nr:MAG: deoxyribodipyrimidine photo-lyase [Actinomycetota bacterium]